MSSKAQKPKQRGVPYETQEVIVRDICERIANGVSLHEALEEIPEAPNPGMFYYWLAKDETRALVEMYDHARETQADVIVDNIFRTIASEPDVQRARLLADTTKWVACKFRPGRYGERVALAGDKHGAPIKVIMAKEDGDL